MSPCAAHAEPLLFALADDALIRLAKVREQRATRGPPMCVVFCLNPLIASPRFSPPLPCPIPPRAPSSMGSTPDYCERKVRLSDNYPVS